MRYDFIVVGAGIAGASISYELAEAGRVCLVEGESRAGIHATGRSAALFAPSYGGAEIRAITRASRAFFDNPPTGFCERPLLEERGCLYIASHEQRDNLAAMVAAIRDSGGEVDILGAEEAIARVPLLRRDYLFGAAFDADAMDIDVAGLHQAFLKGAKARGAELRLESWIRTARHADGIWSLDIQDDTIEAPIVINAAGAWADEVAISCGADPVGLQPLRRTALLVDPPEGCDIRRWPAVIDVDEMFYFKPDAGKLLLSPADETPVPAGDALPEEIDIAIGVDRVQAALDIEVRRVSHSWAGLRTFSPDRVPVVGFDPRRPGFFWCAGQGGYGIQTAPALGRLAAALVQRKPVPADILAEGLVVEDLSPDRFSASAASSPTAAAAKG